MTLKWGVSLIHQVWAPLVPFSFPICSFLVSAIGLLKGRSFVLHSLILTLYCLSFRLWVGLSRAIPSP